MNGRSRKGFTLIELLVVISIIGFLSSVALASLKSARTKASDTAIKSNFQTVKTQTQLYYSIYGHYGTAAITNTACNSLTGLPIAQSMFADPTIANAIKAAERVSGGLGTARCASEPSPGPALDWVISAPSVGNPGYYWCIDSLGNSGLLLANVAPLIHHFCFETP